MVLGSSSASQSGSSALRRRRRVSVPPASEWVPLTEAHGKPAFTFSAWTLPAPGDRGKVEAFGLGRSYPAKGKAEADWENEVFSCLGCF